MDKRLLLLAEHDGRHLTGPTYQAIAKCRQLADACAAEFALLILGHELASTQQSIAASAVDLAFVADDQRLGEYNPELYAVVVAQLVKQIRPQLLLLGDSFLAREIGPAVAAKLDAPLLGNCIDVELSEEKVTVTQPRHGGAICVKGELPTPPLLLIQLQGGGGGSSPLPRPAQPPKIVPLAIGIDDRGLRTRVLGETYPAAGAVDITTAAVVIAVGRGIGKEEGVPTVRALAEALGGVVACSRPLCDMGWLPPEHLVGMSGHSIRPKVYLACGISGAVQHLAGMREAQRIIAINKDATAPILSVAHYAAICDLAELLPLLITEARAQARRDLPEADGDDRAALC